MFLASEIRQLLCCTSSQHVALCASPVSALCTDSMGSRTWMGPFDCHLESSSRHGNCEEAAIMLLIPNELNLNSTSSRRQIHVTAKLNMPSKASRLQSGSDREWGLTFTNSDASQIRKSSLMRSNSLWN